MSSRLQDVVMGAAVSQRFITRGVVLRLQALQLLVLQMLLTSVMNRTPVAYQFGDCPQGPAMMMHTQRSVGVRQKQNRQAPSSWHRLCGEAHPAAASRVRVQRQCRLALGAAAWRGCSMLKTCNTVSRRCRPRPSGCCTPDNSGVTEGFF
jgi:hypothetical protein